MPGHSYGAAERFILSREFFGMKLGLENISEFLASIGSPQAKLQTIHIAGTNGKGSTAAMLDAVLRAQGYKTGLFTSPHLVSLRERVCVDGRRIPTRSVTAFIDRYRKVLSQRKLSFFELITAMGLYYFARVGVDIAVIETGLGGRLDATNVLNPILTLTTDISHDHVEILGSTVARIAAEKAGIIKPSVPHLTGILPAAADRVIRRQCEKLNAPYYRLTPQEFLPLPDKMSFDFSSNGLAMQNLHPSLIGGCQLKNSALVVKAASILNDSGLKISRRAIREGIGNTRWPGRFQVRQYQRKPTHVFDVCHNTAGVRAFVESFEAVFPGRKASVLTGLVKRKEHQKMFDQLSAIAHGYSLVPLKTGRSTDLAELMRTVNWRGVPCRKFGSLETAYFNLLQTCAPDDIIIVIGSHYLVGEFFDKYGIK